MSRRKIPKNFRKIDVQYIEEKSEDTQMYWRPTRQLAYVSVNVPSIESMPLGPCTPGMSREWVRSSVHSSMIPTIRDQQEAVCLDKYQKAAEEVWLKDAGSLEGLESQSSPVNPRIWGASIPEVQYLGHQRDSITVRKIPSVRDWNIYDLSRWKSFTKKAWHISDTVAPAELARAVYELVYVPEVLRKKRRGEK